MSTSKEFGSDRKGCFFEQIETAYEDCIDGSNNLTRLWGAVLKEFYPVSIAINQSESCYGNEAHSIMESMRQMAKIQSALNVVKQYLKPYDEVAEEAVRRMHGTGNAEKHRDD